MRTKQDVVGVDDEEVFPSSHRARQLDELLKYPSAAVRAAGTIVNVAGAVAQHGQLVDKAETATAAKVDDLRLTRCHDVNVADGVIQTVAHAVKAKGQDAEILRYYGDDDIYRFAGRWRKRAFEQSAQQISGFAALRRQ